MISSNDVRLNLLSISIFAILLGAQTSHAIIDMKNANYSNTWTDAEIPGSGYNLKVARTYNSRSLYDGLFGFGWCSDFETRIDITAEGNLNLVECGAGQETMFTPRDYDANNTEKLIAKIIEKAKAQNKYDEKTLAKLKIDLRDDVEARYRWAVSVKISTPIKEGGQFFAHGKEVENIVFSKGSYVRTLADGSLMKFNDKGRLLYVYDKNGNYIKIDYDKEGIREVADNNGRKLNFKLYPNKKVKTITGPFNISIEYKYANPDDLVFVKNSWGNTYAYDYDDLHNLTKVTWPDKTFIALTYDKKRDWVMSYTDRDKCTESYGYEFSKEDPKNHYWATVKKVCGKEVTSEAKHEFWYKERTGQEPYLERISSNVNGNVVDITYHEVFGKPTQIIRGKEKFSFDYYPNGLVKVKAAANTKQSFTYDDKTKKVASVQVENYGDKGKLVQKRKTEFRYDNKNNLIFAQNTEGLKISMTYDTRGRIATIVDQAHKVVKIDYEEKFGKPAVVSRPGLGTINVSYKPNGDIDKVNSAEGPSVAMQVANTFNNLLDIISPATAELYN